MDGMTTDDRLLAQNDIDALLGEAGIEGNYETKAPSSHESPPKNSPSIRFLKRTDEDAKSTISLLHDMAFIEREETVKVIWNALGTISMTSGFNINIQDREYISLGVLHKNHLIVKDLRLGH